MITPTTAVVRLATRAASKLCSGRPDLIDDVAQVALLRWSQSYDASKGSASAWLWFRVRDAASEAVRLDNRAARNRTLATSWSWHPPDPLAALLAKEEVETLTRGVRAADLAATMLEYGGLTAVAENEGVHHCTIARRVHRGLMKMKTNKHRADLIHAREAA